MNTILGRTLLSFLAFLVLIGAIFGSTVMVTGQQKDDGLIVNLSGRQRMLTQKMSKETLIFYRISQAAEVDRPAQKKWENQVKSTMTVFEDTLFALKDGGNAPLDLAMTKFRKSPPAETEAIRQQLERVVNLWTPFKKNIQKVLSSKGKDGKAMDYVIANNVELLGNMNKVVFQMQEQAEKKVALMVKIQIGAIVIGLIVVIGSILAIRASVVSPIKALINAAEAMSTGDLRTEIKASGLKEISVLSNSLNRLRISLSTMIARFSKKAA